MIEKGLLPVFLNDEPLRHPNDPAEIAIPGVALCELELHLDERFSLGAFGDEAVVAADGMNRQPRLSQRFGDERANFARRQEPQLPRRLHFESELHELTAQLV